MWLFLTRRLRMWLILTVVVPLASGLLRTLGEALRKRGGPPAVVNALLKAGSLADRAQEKFAPQRKRKRFGLF